MQGAGINDSEAWVQSEPLPASAARAFLAALTARLPTREYQLRQSVIQQARSFIDRCEAAGGIDHPVSRSFLVRGDRAARRVDIEVVRGKAIVPPPPRDSNKAASP